MSKSLWLFLFCKLYQQIENERSLVSQDDCRQLRIRIYTKNIHQSILTSLAVCIL